jgi:hypothetical protein
MQVAGPPAAGGELHRPAGLVESTDAFELPLLDPQVAGELGART